MIRCAFFLSFLRRYQWRQNSLHINTWIFQVNKDGVAGRKFWKKKHLFVGMAFFTPYKVAILEQHIS